MALVKVHARTVPTLATDPDALTLCGIRALSVGSVPVADFRKLPPEHVMLANGSEPCETCGYAAYADAPDFAEAERRNFSDDPRDHVTAACGRTDSHGPHGLSTGRFCVGNIGPMVTEQ